MSEVHGISIEMRVMSMFHWEHLPDDVWQHIFSHLPVSGVGACASTSKIWNRLAKCETIWKTKCEGLQIVEKPEDKLWRDVLSARASWCALQGSWDIHWDTKFNRKLFTISSVFTANPQIANNINANVSKIRVGFVGKKSVFVFDMKHDASGRVFTYLVEQIPAKAMETFPALRKSPAVDGMLQDFFAVQVYRHEDHSWYQGYLVRGETAYASVTAAELDQHYKFDDSIRYHFVAPPPPAEEVSEASDDDDSAESVTDIDSASDTDAE